MVLFLGGHTFYDDYATARVKRLPPHSLFVIVCTFEQILRFPWEYHAVSPEKSRCLLDVQELYLIRTLSVVGFDAGGKGKIHQLPIGATLTITGRDSLPGFVEIVHDGEVCHTFEKDLQDRSQSSERTFGAKRA